MKETNESNYSDPWCMLFCFVFFLDLTLSEVEKYLNLQ